MPTDRPGPKPTGSLDEGPTLGGKAMIDSVEVLMRESMPVQVSVSVKGNLADACTRIDEITTTRDGNTFNIDITTARPAELMCAQVLTPFEENISLEARGLKKGTYAVNVNGVTQTFELAVDNE
jgi:inhibitor of cysteine peptidase